MSVSHVQGTTGQGSSAPRIVALRGEARSFELGSWRAVMLGGRASTMDNESQSEDR